MYHLYRLTQGGWVPNPPCFIGIDWPREGGCPNLPTSSVLTYPPSFLCQPNCRTDDGNWWLFLFRWKHRVWSKLSEWYQYNTPSLVIVVDISYNSSVAYYLYVVRKYLLPSFLQCDYLSLVMWPPYLFVWGCVTVRQPTNTHSKSYSHQTPTAMSHGKCINLTFFAVWNVRVALGR